MRKIETIWLSLAILIFIASCSIGQNDVEISKVEREHLPVVEPQNYLNFWQAMQRFDITFAEHHEVSQHEARFQQILSGCLAGQYREAIQQFMDLHATSSDTSLKRHVETVLSELLFLEADWQSLLALDDQTGALARSEDNIRPLVEAFANEKKEEVQFPQGKMTLPITLGLSGVPQVEVTINGVVKTFWIDTGAGLSTIASDVAEEIGLKPIGEEITKAGTSTDIEVDIQPAIVSSLQVGECKFRNHRVAVIPYEDLQFKLLGLVTIIKVDGILGWNWIQKLDLELDYAGKKMTIHQPRRIETIKPNLLWFETPIVRLNTANGKPLFFALDTGANSTSIGDNCLAKVDTTGITRSEKKVGGAGGTQSFITKTLPNFSIVLGNYKMTFPEIDTGIDNETDFFVLDGTVGGDIVQNGKMRIDFTNGRLEVSYLEKPVD